MKKSETIKEAEDIKINKSENQFNNALAVLKNTIVRAQTKWSIEETKLFLMCISQVKKRNSDNWISLKKVDVYEKMGIDRQNTNKLRSKVKSMMQKSMILIEDKNSFDYGFMFTNIKSDRKTVSVQINKTYLPLVEDLSQQFTEIYIDNVVGFKSKHSISLYMYLSSWYDKEFAIQKTYIPKEYIHKCFNLKENEYWRNYGTNRQKIDWNALEKRVIKQAIEDINSNKQTDIFILEYKKKTKNREILGYQITWEPVEHDEISRKLAIKI